MLAQVSLCAPPCEYADVYADVHVCEFAVCMLAVEMNKCL
jgi:hypothetical protein